MSRVKTLIIGVLLSLLLGGCSAIRLGYDNGSQLAWWWIDGYFDFSSEQAPQVKKALDRWFEWHRSSQLPQYAAFLASSQQQALEPTTAAQACAWQEKARELLEPSFARAVQEFADIVPSMGEPQFKALEQRYAKSNEEMRSEFLNPDPAERLRESIKRTVERTERIYGRLGEAQIKVISAGVSASPFNPELWLAERQRRQRDTLQTLRKLVADKADRETRVAVLRAWAQRAEKSSNPEYRAYQLKLTEYNCNLAAQVHNSTTPAQRQKARDNLRGWEEDLRVLAAGQPATAAPSPGGG